ncbi:Hypothetical predicted protein [Pelobates cultripes]|uniref:Uncharacterized protein n=1 Tax=Pelobates cultripes TaxID=61616 RepID=A0AAD1S2P3_PELCU|nr:Hypothetical predicted protein [Pelobates cultripes]
MQLGEKEEGGERALQLQTPIRISQPQEVTSLQRKRRRSALYIPLDLATTGLTTEVKNIEE